MTEQHDRDGLVELMSRYANMPDTQTRGLDGGGEGLTSQPYGRRVSPPEETRHARTADQRLVK